MTRAPIFTQHGYVLVYVGRGHHLANSNGYAYEHRVVAEEMLGRRLQPGEEVHHRDGDGTNNARCNLVVEPSRAAHKVEHRTSGEHRRLPGEPNPTIQCACGCGGQLLRYDECNRPRSHLPGHARRPRRPKPSAIVECACGCGSRFEMYDSGGRPRRFVSGHNPPKTKLTASQVEAVRRAIGDGATQSSLARHYSVSESLISQIANGRGYYARDL